MRRAAHRAGLVLTVVALATACSGSPNAAVSVPAQQIRVGQCVVPPKTPTAELSTVSVVPCSERHTQEAYALVTFVPASSAASLGDTYPGADVLKKFADGACAQRYPEYIGVTYADSSLFFTYLLPSARGWSAKDRVVTCFVTTTGVSLTKSVKGTKL